MRVANATPGTGALASIYAVDNTASPIAGSVVTTDSTGTFSFYAPDGRYDLVVAFGATTKIVADIEIADITESQSGDVAAKFGTLNFTTAFQHNGVPFAAADLSDGNSGTGAIAHVTSPVFVTPALGDATASSVAATSGVPFTALSGSSNNMQVNLGRSVVEVNLAVPQANGFYFTNSDLAAGDFVIRQLTSGRKIYLGTGASGASLAVTNAGLNFYTTSGTLTATIANDGSGGLSITGNGGSGMTFTSAGNLFLSPGRSLNLEGGTSGITSLIATAIASGTLTFPAATDTLVGKATTDTLTNKRITQRVVTVTNSTTLTPDGDNSDVSAQVNTQVAGTLTIAAPTGTPTDGQKLIIRIKSTNAQTYSFNATYAFSTSVTAPTTLAAGKTDYIGLMWNATNTKWDVVAVDQGH